MRTGPQQLTKLLPVQFEGKKSDQYLVYAPPKTQHIRECLFVLTACCATAVVFVY